MRNPYLPPEWKRYNLAARRDLSIRLEAINRQHFLNCPHCAAYESDERVR